MTFQKKKKKDNTEKTGHKGLNAEEETTPQRTLKDRVWVLPVAGSENAHCVQPTWRSNHPHKRKGSAPKLRKASAKK